MNRTALLHITDSNYCFPVSGNEIVIRFRAAKNDLKRVDLIYESKYFIAKRQKKAEMRKAYTTGLFDFYEIRLKLKDVRFAYIFLLDGDEGQFYYSEDGATRDYDFSMCYYNFFQYPYINKADVHETVGWLRTASIYQIFVDRFMMGNRDKDRSYIDMKWTDRPTPKSHAGGDLKGITKKLGYIKGLGFDTVYLTPIFRSGSNHKYDIEDYYLVDPQFGTNEDLKELIDKAHGRNMHIILDAVFNHCSENIAQFRDVVKKGRKSKYFDWFIIDGDEINENRSNYEVFATCHYMPKLNTSNPEVQEYLLGIAVHYIEKYGIDGWRLDVSDEISHDFWRKFRIAVKEAGKRVGKEIAIIGENWHDAASYLRGDQYDSIMNYGVTKACLDHFAFEKFDAEEFAGRLNEILVRNTTTVNDMMMNLLDCHDTVRFITSVKGNKTRLKAALALIYLFPGAPCVYYGTEILTEGGPDPDCRRCMDWNKAGSAEYADIAELLKTLSAIRKKQKLYDGEIGVCAVKGTFVFKNENKKRTITLKIKLAKNGKDRFELSIKDNKNKGAEERIYG
ncbi:MAG: alpha-glycosidase [Lachnospiraceae bacterium]|nr:alpha-glycosidase [Lachnospiraceae bacterium]